jgi:hypothetical protein
LVNTMRIGVYHDAKRGVNESIAILDKVSAILLTSTGLLVSVCPRCGELCTHHHTPVATHAACGGKFRMRITAEAEWPRAVKLLRGAVV